MEKQILRRTFIFYVKTPPRIFKSGSILFSTLRYVAEANRVSFPMQSTSFLRLSGVEGVEDEKCEICSRSLDHERKPFSKIFPKRVIIGTAQMCMKKLRILLMHLVKYIDLVRIYFTFDARKSKTNMAEKNY